MNGVRNTSYAHHRMKEAIIKDIFPCFMLDHLLGSCHALLRLMRRLIRKRRKMSKPRE